VRQKLAPLKQELLRLQNIHLPNPDSLLATLEEIRDRGIWIALFCLVAVLSSASFNTVEIKLF
jgi:hypothetical protein